MVIIYDIVGIIMARSRNEPRTPQLMFFVLSLSASQIITADNTNSSYIAYSFKSPIQTINDTQNPQFSNPNKIKYEL